MISVILLQHNDGISSIYEPDGVGLEKDKYNITKLSDYFYICITLNQLKSMSGW